MRFQVQPGAAITECLVDGVVASVSAGRLPRDVFANPRDWEDIVKIYTAHHRPTFEVQRSEEGFPFISVAVAGHFVRIFSDAHCPNGGLQFYFGEAG